MPGVDHVPGNLIGLGFLAVIWLASTLGGLGGLLVCAIIYLKA